MINDTTGNCIAGWVD